MTDATTNTFRLILGPSVLTLLISAARLVGERQGWFPVEAGGSGHWLGITWLGFLLGVWFALRLRRSGSMPRVSRPWAWSLASLLPIVAAAGLTVPAVMDAATDEAGLAALRTSALAMTAGALVAALVQFVVWPKLAWTMLVYAIPARATVIALTWLAKHNDWDSHYTKFGPKGYVRGMEDTMVSATIMQLGFWVPLTIVVGTLLGGLFCGRRPAQP